MASEKARIWIEAYVGSFSPGEFDKLVVRSLLNRGVPRMDAERLVRRYSRYVDDWYEGRPEGAADYILNDQMN